MSICSDKLKTDLHALGIAYMAYDAREDVCKTFRETSFNALWDALQQMEAKEVAASLLRDASFCANAPRSTFLLNYFLLDASKEKHDSLDLS